MRPQQVAQPVSASRQKRDFEGETFDLRGEAEANKLSWTRNDSSIVVSGSSDYGQLSGLKNAVLLLVQEFFGSGSQVAIQGEKRDDLQRRLLLVEHEIDGLLRRRIEFSVKDANGSRNLDYTGLLNEKENQIVELERKILNLEERFKKVGSKENELANQVSQLTADLKRKDDIIKMKNDVILAEYARSNELKETLLRLKRTWESSRNRGDLNNLFDGVNVSADDVRADALTKDGANRGGVSALTKTRGSMVVLFREFERLLNNPNVVQDDIDKALEGFLTGMEGSRWRVTVQDLIERNKWRTQYDNLTSKFAAAAGLWRGQLTKLGQKFGTVVDFDSDISDLLKNTNVTVSVVNGVVQVERFSEKTIEIPVQDVRTKKLIHSLATQMKKFTDKYPKLRDEMDVRLWEYFQQEIIDIIEVDEVDRIVEIVRYVPQVVKVENVYAYSSEKSRRIEFHLRVLIKALLEELEKLRVRTGLVLEMDEALLAMISQEIMGVIDIDDVLKVFRIVPKIVEVEKIIEKIVERVVEVPQVVTIEKIVEKVIEVPRIQEIERIVHVPVEVIKIVDNVIEKIVEVERYQERIVEVPRIIERIVEKVVEVPKVIEVEKIVERIVPVTEVVTVEKIVNNLVPEIRTVEIVIEKVVPVERIVEKIVEVPTYIEKIVEKPVEVIKVVEVEKIVERLVRETDFKIVERKILEVQPIYKEVERIVEKIVVVENIVEKIVEVPQIIEKIIQVNNEIVRIVEVEVIKEKLVPVIQIKEVEKVVNTVVTLIKEVEKIVDRKVEVPIIVEKIVKVPEIINNVVIERVEVPKIIEIEKLVEKLIIETKLIEVEKPIVHYIKDIQIVKTIIEKIVEVPRTVERIKEVRVHIDKIIEKMVEVPKVVEVERIVEKIVVVPRVVEKIVEVIQIVEKIVERIIEVERIREVERIVQVPAIVEKVVEIEVLKNVYIEVEKPVERIVEKIVPVERVVEKVVNVSNDVERIVQVSVEVPKVLEVEKIVSKMFEREKVVEIERPTTVTVEVPVEVERIVQKVVPVDKIIEKIVQVPQMVERVVQVHSQNTKVIEVDRVVEKIVQREVPKAVPTTEIVIQERFKEVPTVVEKIVTVTKTVRDIQIVQQILEKIVQVAIEVPKIVEIERLVEKLVEVPKVVELEVLVPQLIKVNQIIERLVEKIVPITTIREVIKEITTNSEKIVAVNNTNTQIKEVQVFRDKIIEVPKVVEISSTKNFVETQLQVVDRYEQKEIPVYSSVEKLIEVPYILEKIVEKIVVMPQVVEILKYVHEIAETDTLLAVGVDVSVQEARYRDIYGRLKIQFDVLLVELRKLKAANPALRVVVEVIETYLVEFDKIAAFQRIIKVPTQVEVEKEVFKPILVPTKDSAFIRGELALSLLVEKLVVELKRVKKDNPSVRLNLDEDIQLIFLSEFGSNVQGDLANSLKTYTDSALKKFSSIGGNWGRDHELMLYTILQERFVMANLIKNANLEIEKAKAISDKRLEGLRRYKQTNSLFQEKYQKLESALSQGSVGSHVTVLLGDFKNIFSQDFGTWVNDEEPLRIFGDLHGTGEDFARLQGMYREAMYNVDLLREKLIASEKARVSTGTSSIDFSRNNDALKKEIQSQQEEIRKLRSQIPITGSSGAGNQDYETKIRTLQSRIQDLEAQIRTSKLDYDNQIRSYTSKIENLERQLKLTNTPKSEVSAGSTNNQSGYTPVAGGSQNFGTTSVTTPQKAGSSYGYTPSYTGGTGSLSTPGTTSQVIGKPSTGNVAGESSYSYSSSSSSATTPRTTGTTVTSGAGNTTGTTYGATNYGATNYGTTGTTSYGATGTYGNSSSSSSGLSNSGVRTSGTLGGTGYSTGTTGATGVAFGSSSGTLSGSGYTTGTTGYTTGTTGSTGYTSSTGYNTGNKTTGYTYKN